MDSYLSWDTAHVQMGKSAAARVSPVDAANESGSRHNSICCQMRGKICVDANSSSESISKESVCFKAALIQILPGGRWDFDTISFVLPANFTWQIYGFSIILTKLNIKRSLPDASICSVSGVSKKHI
jgi:hypothetical protein